ncbi:MAG: hypothetical protein V3W31_03680, partial [Thermodesulfobacteriota bacterium]
KRIRRLSVFILPGFIVWGGIFLYFAGVGRFGPFWEAVFEYNRYYAAYNTGGILTNLRSFLTNSEFFFSPALKEVWPLGLLSAAWLPLSRGTYGPVRRSFFVLLLLGTLVAVAAPGLFFPHYYQLLLPPLIIVSALFLSDLAGFMEARAPSLKAGGVTLTFLLAAGYLSYHQALYLMMGPEEISEKKYGTIFIHSRELGKRIGETTTPCDTIYEWGAETGLYYYSRRKAASGIFNVYHLMVGPLEYRFKKFEKLSASLENSPPALFIWSNRYGKVDDGPLARFIRDNYNPVGIYMEYDIYEYKHRKAPGGDDCTEKEKTG